MQYIAPLSPLVLFVHGTNIEKIDRRLADGRVIPVVGEALYTRGEGVKNTDVNG